MKKALLFAVLMVMAFPGAARAMPLVESDYLKGEAEHFKSADSNRNGLIDKDEAYAAFLTIDLLPNETARAACSKAGKIFAREYNPAENDPESYQPMDLQRYMAFRKSMFDRIDTNHDKVIVQSEMDDFNKSMIAVCDAMPGVMRQVREAGGLQNLTPEVRAEVIQKLKALRPPDGAAAEGR